MALLREVLRASISPHFPDLLRLPLGRVSGISRLGRPTPLGMGWYASYLQNWKAGYGQFDGGFGHLWSLAFEEQFYLIWPLIVLPFSRGLVVFCWALIIGALSARLWMRFGLHFSLEGIHRLTYCRIDTFAVGALATLAVRNNRAWIVGHARSIQVSSGFTVKFTADRASKSVLTESF
jgi:peptidoglycan/LPS O-acetylase OafA/YrhL